MRGGNSVGPRSASGICNARQDLSPQAASELELLSHVGCVVCVWWEVRGDPSPVWNSPFWILLQEEEFASPGCRLHPGRYLHAECVMGPSRFLFLCTSFCV